MRCARALVLLLVVAACWAQQVADTEELTQQQQQQLPTRRRRVSDLADVEGEDGDVATPEEGDEERLPPPNRPNRQRNPNRRRRKRKRIPPPRPLYEDYEDSLAFPTTGDKDPERFLDERPREPPTGPEHRSGAQDRRRLRDGEEEDDERPPRRDRQRDREGQPSVQRPFREHAPYLVNEDGEPRPQRPLRRRRKNRRRPPVGHPEGIKEEPVEDGESPLRDAPEDPPGNQEKGAITEVELKAPPSDGSPPGPDRRSEGASAPRGRHRQTEDIPLGSLRGEVRLPAPPRQKSRAGVVAESGPDSDAAARRPHTTTPESLPAENLPSNNFDNQPPRQRRRRIRPRNQNKSTTTEKTTVAVINATEENVTTTSASEVDAMLADREPLKLREEAPMVLRKEDDDDDVDDAKDSSPAATSGKAEDEDPDAGETSIVSGDITLQTTPIKISLSDLLREKNISIEEILKDADEEEPPPPPRFQRPPKSRPPPPTPKTIVTPKLTQLSRVHQFLQKPKPNRGREDDAKKDPESKVQSHKSLNATTTSTTTHRAYTQTTPSTHRTSPPTKTTTTPKTTTQRKYSSSTSTTQRFHTTTTTTTTTERVVGRPVGFGARAPALNMQETEDIDPVKMTGKSRAGNNSKAAEFLKSRVRLPPSGVLFPSSVKTGQQGLRGGQSPPSAPDRKAASEAPPPNAESNRIPGPVAPESDAVLTHNNVPVYVLNPKYYRASQPKTEAPLSPTETNLIPKGVADPPAAPTTTTRRAETTTTEGFADRQMITDADPVRLNIPLRSGAEGDEDDASGAGTESTRGKSAEDEIVELLETENGSGRLSRILASRNMTLSELIEHRERGASQQHISDIFLRSEEAKVVPEVTEVTEAEGTTAIPKVEQVRAVQNSPARKLNVEIVEVEEEEEEDEGENSKRVPRVFEGLAPFRPKVEVVPELEFKVPQPENTPDYSVETYGSHGRHENPGKVREVVTKVADEDDPGEFAGLPTGMKSAILASSAILGLAVFVFLAIFVTCKVRRRQTVRRRYANRSPILSHHDVEKSRSMTPVLRHSGYKDMTEERRYYLWNTIRKTLRYK